MMIEKLIYHLHQLTARFAEQTHALAVDFMEDKKRAEWTITYNIIKIQFVLTKKEKLLCPIATLFCRVYLGKNDTYFYHLPEFAEYLEPDSFKCYYFPYMESEQRLDACFAVYERYFEKHLRTIQAFAKSSEISEKIQENKKKEIISLFMNKGFEKEMESFAVEGYESYVLLPRFLAEGPYREFVCGNIENAKKLFKQQASKGLLTTYEKNLLVFMENLPADYEVLPKECNTLNSIKKLNAGSSEGLAIFLASLVCEMILGTVFTIVTGAICAVLANGTVFYAGMDWFTGFLFTGTPAIFGGIAFRNHIRKILKKKEYEEVQSFFALANPQWVETFARSVFVITLVGSLFITICTSFMSTQFYETHMTYDEGEKLLPGERTTCYYEDLVHVYYTEGLYNDFGDYIERASYVLEFADGTIWDSDVFTSVEVVEESILPLLESYYEEIEYKKVRP